MKKLIPLGIMIVLVGAGSAFAQTGPPVTPAPKTISPSTSVSGAALVLTDDQAKSWINKAVYSSDAKNVGEVGAVQRDLTGKVTEMHADIGGFLGLGETRVQVMPGQFKLADDRIVLNQTAEQVKTLPKIAK